MIKTYQWIKKPQTMVFCVFVFIVGYYFVDKPVATFFYELHLREVLALHLVTILGKWSFYALWFALAGLYFRYLRHNLLYESRAWFLLGCVLFPNILNALLKVTLSRARPELLFASGEYGFYWFQFKDAFWSFPSGHATTCGALLAGLWVLFPRYFLGFFVVALLVCATRVLLYKHYLSDVFAGFYLGMLVVGFYSSYLSGYVDKIKGRS